MNALIRDLNNHARSLPNTGRARYQEARNQGATREAAARRASISLEYARQLDVEVHNSSLTAEPLPVEDDRHVQALIALGGFPSLSERMTRTGHVVCLPLVPFEVRP